MGSKTPNQLSFGNFISNYLNHPSLEPLINPVFLTWVSASLHLVLLLGLFTSWIRRNSRFGIPIVDPSSNDTVFINSQYRTTRLCCLLLAVYNFSLTCLDCYFWYTINDWSDPVNNLVALLDLVVRSLVWLALFLYLPKSRFPLLLRIWWVFYFTVSCYCRLIFDLKHQEDQPARFLVSGFIYLITGSVFCYALVFGKVVIEPIGLLEEPLLNVPIKIGDESESVSLYSSAGIVSILTFSWIRPLISTGYNKVLDLDDVDQLPDKDGVELSFRNFRTCLDSVCEGDINQLTSLRLLKSLIYTVWGDVLSTFFLALIYTIATYVGPYLIDDFLQYLNGRRRYDHEGYALVSALFVAKLVECFAQRHWHFTLQRVGIRLRSSLVTMIYNKGLTLSCRSKKSNTSGEMINFMAVDAQRVSLACFIMHYPSIACIEVILAMLILYKNLGLASIVAFVALVIVILVNYPLANLLEKIQGKLMESKGKRMKATTEILKNMKVLKLQAWEMKFLSKISRLRESEVAWLKKYLYTSAATASVFWSAPTFLSVVTFVACLFMGIPLEAGKILSALATFRMLSRPILALPEIISMFVQTKVSMHRITSFLRLEDLKPDVVERIPRPASEVAVEIIGGTFDWDSSFSSNYDPTLKDINVNISHGMTVAVCGTVGSGKSSLLSCILGEMPKLFGTLRVSGSVSYVSQSAWIHSGTIVDNILFGREMDQDKYESVLESCSLKKDLLQDFAFGDQTVIGERGINLSGGQKQRIQIARALYQDTDIYLFDDPFSAVDAHTSTHLFKECLLGLLKSKTVVFVTHQVEFLPAADLILVMKDGRISQAGKYDDILASGSDLMELVGAHEKAMATLDSVQTIRPSSSSTIFVKEEKDIPNSTSQLLEDRVEHKTQELFQEEEREKGKVGFTVYWKYMTTAYKGALIPFILLAHISFQIIMIASNYWMTLATPASADNKHAAVDSTTLIVVYVAFSVGGAVCTLLRETLLSTFAYKTATLFFDKMHFCIFRAPMAFFDSTPSGRVLNRASIDQNAVDMIIPDQIADVAFITIQLLATVAIISQVAWQVFVIFIPIACLCLCYQQYYLPAARELTRLVGVYKAPVMQHFAETISGASTIRGFAQQSRFQNKCTELIDGYSRPIFHISGAQEWLIIRLELLSSVTFACSLIFLISIPTGTINAGIAGLAVTYGLSLNMFQVSAIMRLCQLENDIISVERILQYTNISSEPSLVMDANKPAPSWPSHGEVEIHDLQVRYALHLPIVLRGISCTFQGGKKTGIVGRTGSGKSTLIHALFRIVDPASGSILIDGVDISMIGLHDLRSRLSIIPQEPVMFEGTIRNNLDPLEEYTDEHIWQALDKCQLGDEVRKKEEKLDSLVRENGENWSMGQRQLVCLGRVLLKKSKILVLDEATASVDTATDNLIQQTLRQHLSESTVLIVAHRITCVLDCDMVLVLSQGVVEECDTPTRLIEDGSSSFAKLVAEYTSRSKSSQH